MVQPDIATMDYGGRSIAYRRRAGTRPTLLFLPGFASDMEGAKALAIDAFAGERRLGCLRMDYSGTGSSGGDFAQGTLARWLDEALALIDKHSDGPLIAIGSSMGGWIALHVALRRPDRFAALVGIAAAPDFTDWGFGAAQRETIVNEGSIGPPEHRIHRGFWQSGQSLCLLDSPLALGCPVRLIHGDQDRDVPLDIAFRLMRALGSADVQLTVIKNGGHRLSEPLEIAAILRVIANLLEPQCP
jgi:pimeloyl-ACP methyl ester carboxylesterase